MNKKLQEIKNCEVCGNSQLVSVLDLGLHPMCDDLVKLGDTRICNEYPIEILFCKNCNTAHQRFQVPKQDLFPNTYHYRARFTTDVLNGMINLVESCETHYGNLSGKKVLDIGCNDGSLLSFFREKGAITIGIEPTDAYLDAKQKGHMVFNDFLSEKLANLVVESQGKPDFITFTNVFAHIENLPEVIGSLKILIGPFTVIVIENHYLGAVLDGNQFDTFYHEHPRTYSFMSFIHIARSLGLQIQDVEFPSRYGGNIRVLLSNATSLKRVQNSTLVDLNRKESQFFENFILLRSNILTWKENKRKALGELYKKYGKLQAKAFPGRSAILVKLLGLNEDFISAVYEKPGSMKVGYYLPGTRIPIRSDLDLCDKTQPLINMAWHISEEIHKYMKKNGYEGQIIDILTEEDFESVKCNT